MLRSWSCRKITSACEILTSGRFTCVSLPSTALEHGGCNIVPSLHDPLTGGPVPSLTCFNWHWHSYKRTFCFWNRDLRAEDDAQNRWEESFPNSTRCYPSHLILTVVSWQWHDQTVVSWQWHDLGSLQNLKEGGGTDLDTSKCNFFRRGMLETCLVHFASKTVFKHYFTKKDIERDSQSQVSDDTMGEVFFPGLERHFLKTSKSKAG